MDSGAQRFVVAAVLLIAVWIVTYWLWPAPGVVDGAITFDAGTTTAALPEGRPSGVRQPAPTQAPVLDPSPVGLGSQSVGQPPIAPTPGGAGPAPTPATPEPAPEAPQRRPGVIPPEFVEYVVKPGDDCARIAERFYGDRNLWHVVAKANSRVDPQRLKAGQRLRIAVDPNNIQGLPVDGAPDSPQPAAAPEHAGTIEYTVRRGDTLSDIAKHFYNRSSAWQIIYDANRKVLKTPEGIKPGMKLRIPPAPARKAS